MSFVKLKSEYHIRCNAAGCANTLNTQVRASKTGAWHTAKTRGWLIRHIGSIWRHYCSKACYDAPVDKTGEADHGAA
jgi:hypothetical protein